MGANRENLIAHIGGSGGKLPLAFTGHVDVVPLGALPWNVEPFGGSIADGKGLRARQQRYEERRGCVRLRRGKARAQASRYAWCPACDYRGRGAGMRGGSFHAGKCHAAAAGALIVGEPTANEVLAGHKGSFWVEATARGVTAHGSMPEKGVNAVYKAARAVLALAAFDFSAEAHPLLGSSDAERGLAARRA